MELISGKPFWPTRSGLIRSYPRLTASTTADVVVIGAGITGALIADRLTQAGHSVVVLDQRDVGAGSTSASTALLQYEIDTPLTELIERYGTESGVGAYQACLRAISEVSRLDQELGSAGGFQPRTSLYFASTADELPDLVAEYECRREYGLPVEYWDAATFGTRFEFSAPGAIYSKIGGQVDPYRLAHALLHRVVERGGRVYDRTEVAEVDGSTNVMRVLTADGVEIHARRVVVACGYESQSFLPRPVATLHSTYAFVSQPLSDFVGWYEECLLWETARPYLYLRTTEDGRLLAGGADLPFRNTAARDALLNTKVEQIADRVRSMFPRLSIDVDFPWTGTFAETDDGLPFIGPHSERPGMLFALCYGGNGITYSALAAEMIAAELEGQPHPLADLFAFDRLPPHSTGIVDSIGAFLKSVSD